MTLAELEIKLDTALAEGRMTAEEAEAEYQDFLHRDEVWQEF